MSELRQHVKALHRPQAMRRSNPDLARSHASEHHRFGSASHYHAGPNAGARQRPPGWATGAGVVLKSQ